MLDAAARNQETEMKLRAITLLLLLLPAYDAIGRPAAAQPETMTWMVNGVERLGIVYAPSKPGRGKAPLIFAFHGSGDNAEHFTITGFHDAWPEAIVVYMQALEQSRGQGNTAFQNSDAGPGNADLKFFDVALADMRRKFKVDDSKIFAAGFSNGGRFVYLLWAARDRIFSAFAAVAGTMNPSLIPKEPKPLIAITGRQDPGFPQHMQSIEKAKKVNYAENSGEPCGAACTLYKSSANSPVITVIHDGAHMYPSSATDYIVSFFRLRP
jgi:polyhydroxybutyrate depolymerase